MYSKMAQVIVERLRLDEAVKNESHYKISVLKTAAESYQILLSELFQDMVWNGYELTEGWLHILSVDMALAERFERSRRNSQWFDCEQVVRILMLLSDRVNKEPGLTSDTPKNKAELTILRNCLQLHVQTLAMKWYAELRLMSDEASFIARLDRYHQNSEHEILESIDITPGSILPMPGLYVMFLNLIDLLQRQEGN